MPERKGKQDQAQIIHLRLISLLVPCIVVIDQISKFLICRLISENQSIPVIKNVFSLTLVRNTGAAFGILKGQNFFFILLTLCVLAGIFLFVLKDEFSLLRSWNRSMFLGISFVLGGAIGNLIDRLIFGYVIDFLDFKIWPVFNIADSMITIGAVIIGIALIVRRNS